MASTFAFKKKPAVKSWTLDEGVAFIRGIQEEARAYNYHVALGGGVLNNGSSDKDLDIYFLSMNNGDMTHPDGMLGFLVARLGKSIPIGKNYVEDRAYAHKVSFQLWDGRRIDAFIV